jgi:hypothetical protein
MTHPSMHERARLVFNGQKPDRPPLITRIDFWQRHHRFAGTLPTEFAGLSIVEISKRLGIGRQASQAPCAYRLRGVDLRITFENEVIYHQSDPELSHFPFLRDLLPDDRPGESLIEYITPHGELTIRQVMSAATLASGVTLAIVKKHPISALEDYAIYETLLEKAEFIPLFDSFKKAEAGLGEDGWLIPRLGRMPFQHLLLDALGEVALFYALHDQPASVERLLRLLDERNSEDLNMLADLNVPFVEFDDNLDGVMTNPRLFAKYVMPVYQKYASICHAQGKKLGSHTDGNLKPLVNLLPQCGLDVCESFTPHPLTPLTFDEAWRIWQKGPLMWGGIPSYYLEDRVGEEEFEAYIDHILELTRDSPIILGVVDAVMADNQIERLRRIAEKIQLLAVQ